MKDPNNNKDEDTHADQCDGRQQHAVAGSKVQFSAPTKKREREGGRETKKDCHMLFYVLPSDRKTMQLPKCWTLAETVLC